MSLKNPLLILVLMSIVSIVALLIEWYKCLSASTPFEKFQCHRILDIIEGFAMSMIIITILVALAYREELKRASRG